MAESHFISTKCCSKCGLQKAEDEFPWHSKKDGRRRADCRECRAIHQAGHHSANKDKINARKAERRDPERESKRNKDWYQRNIGPERAKRAAWRADNLDRARAATAKWRAENPDKQKEAERVWRENNPEAVRLKSLVRRTRILKVGGKLSAGIVDKLMKLQGGLCACCGKSLKGGYHIDHIVPLALEGQNIDSNIQLLTPLCNLQKKARHPIDFMQSRGFLL